MNLPNDTQRLTVFGRTGSGKTVAAMWHFSLRSYPWRPWIVYDYKGDKLIGEIPGAEEIGLNEVPKHAGVYIVRPKPEVDDELVEQQMWGIWERGRIGVYVDEGYMISKRNAAFNAILTQGRSKQIPMITLSQRPVWMSRFVISEADFFQIFFLSDESDEDVVQRFIPHQMDTRALPNFYSYYHDIGANDFRVLAPVPHPDDILETFRDRIRPHRRFL